MGRPVKAGSRIRGGKVYMRLRGEEWLLGPRSEWPDRRIEEERERVVTAYKAGQWHGPSSTRNGASRSDVPTFKEEVGRYLNALRNKAKPGSSTVERAEWEISHLRAFFDDVPLNEIDRAKLEEFQALKIRERELLKDLRSRPYDALTKAERETLEEAQNTIGLSSSSINRVVQRLGAVIERAREGYPHEIPINAARFKSLKLHQKKPSRNIVEVYQAAEIFEAAAELERTARADRNLLGRPTSIKTLTLTGLRIEELMELRRRDVDLTTRKLHVVDAKTPAGIRSVFFSEYMEQELRHYMTEVQTKFDDPDDYLFPTTNRTKRDQDRYRDRILYRAVAEADKQLIASGRPPTAGKVTPTTLRRTYISYALQNGENPRVVMDQVGHVDSSLVMSLYGQVMREPGDPRLREWLGPPTGLVRPR